MWVGSFTITVGEYLIGIGADDAATLDHLRTLFERHLHSSDDDSVDFGVSSSPQRSVGNPLHILWRGDNVVRRSRSVERLIHFLDHTVGQFTRDRVTGRAEIREMTALTYGDRVVLASNELAHRSTAVEQSAIRRGLRLVSSPAIALDADIARVVVHPTLTGSQTPEGATAPGEYELAGIYWSANDSARGHGPSSDVVRLVGRLDLRPAGDNQQLLERLADIALSATRSLGSTDGTWLDDASANLATSSP